MSKSKRLEIRMTEGELATLRRIAELDPRRSVSVYVRWVLYHSAKADLVEAKARGRVSDGAWVRLSPAELDWLHARRAQAAAKSAKADDHAE